ncbi:glycosyltransferase family 2 protein [Natrialbaceae archaeon GCM10025810]|uniref:glycosyltransferase family 2 protein n=1 Tax=Halovalidus salilacus TaxID=3075124 RepID=UPI00361F2D01
MELSVIVSTLNDRERLLSCLDALRERTPPSTEVIVVNGPSTDGTTGVVREREDVDVLVEISERNENVSRNAGLEASSGDAVAFVGDTYTVEPTWYDAVEVGIADGADVVTGPVASGNAGGDDQASPTRVAGRTVTHFHGNNVVFARPVLEALDGFDEYLTVDGDRDCAHRAAELGFDVIWDGRMAVTPAVGTDGGRADREWGESYRSLTYRLTKNYGPRPTVLARTMGSALRDAVHGARAVAAGDRRPTTWFGDGLEVAKNAAGGFRDGVLARYLDRSPHRNPNGVSVRHDRAVRVYDRRS